MRTFRTLILLTAAFGFLLPLAPATTAGKISCEQAVNLFREDLTESGGHGTPEVAASMNLALVSCPTVTDAAEETIDTLTDLILPGAALPCPAAATAYEPRINIHVVVTFAQGGGFGTVETNDDGPGYYAYDPGFRGYTQELFVQGFRSSYALLARDNHEAWIFVAGQPIQADDGMARGGCIGSATPCWAHGYATAVRTDFTIEVTGDFNRCG